MGRQVRCQCLWPEAEVLRFLVVCCLCCTVSAASGSSAIGSWMENKTEVGGGEIITQWEAAL